MSKIGSRQVSPITVAVAVIIVLAIIAAIYFLAFRPRTGTTEELPFKGQGPPTGKGPGMASPQGGGPADQPVGAPPPPGGGGE